MFKNPNFKNHCMSICEIHGADIDAFFLSLAAAVETVTAAEIRQGVPGLAACTDGEIISCCCLRGYETAA